MNVLEPLFERQVLYHSYACRKGKASAWFLKLDNRKYFDSDFLFESLV
jgi:hypothetical protein